MSRHLETGRKDFRLTTLIRVSNALSVPLSELFSGVEVGKPTVRGHKNRAAEQALDRNRILKEVASLESAVSKLRAAVSEKKK